MYLHEFDFENKKIWHTTLILKKSVMPFIYPHINAISKKKHKQKEFFDNTFAVWRYTNLGSLKDFSKRILIVRNGFIIAELLQEYGFLIEPKVTIIVDNCLSRTDKRILEKIIETIK